MCVRTCEDCAAGIERHAAGNSLLKHLLHDIRQLDTLKRICVAEDGSVSLAACTIC